MYIPRNTYILTRGTQEIMHSHYILLQSPSKVGADRDGGRFFFFVFFLPPLEVPARCWSRGDFCMLRESGTVGRSTVCTCPSIFEWE